MPSIDALPIPGLVSSVAAKPAASVRNETPFVSKVTSTSSSSQTSGSDSVQAQAKPSAVKTGPVTAFPGPRFTIDPLSDKSVLEVLNPATGEVVQQLPTREALRRYELNTPVSVQTHPQIGSDLNGQG